MENTIEMSMLNIKQVCIKCGLSRSTIYRLIDSSDFPKAVKLTTKRIAFRAEDIESWLATLEFVN
ncbi:helix-turn-helix transcriptional regulator [Wielerella bovis]|uniref:helix-turn-helix transcriptional regulator n=1 Tax=Wielerella bovis TaxID=2917790 RepID=UPI00201982A3|nr:AlpA family phage regulatory protein [Wielerella bovis]MCG7657505.1 AlpA family phage regulatory protein [Wielerella bovis]MCG7659726.1 AlpA family phage regulatory protein [Wielerella bovis]